ncbi:hypothetical protein ACLOJK_001178 [Asimina triloba]
MAETRNPSKITLQTLQEQNHLSPKPPSWAAVRSLFTCKHHRATTDVMQKNRRKHCKRPGGSGPLRSMRDQMRAANKQEGSGSMRVFDSSYRSFKAPLNEINDRGLHVGRFAGCYDCRMVVDPRSAVARNGSSLRASACTCPDCGEVFTSNERLELHQSVKHAVSELAREDTSRSVVEIIFQSSWLKKQAPLPLCKINRILKVHNSQKTINRFEDYRNSIKAKASKHPRCIADGNELLRFHCTTFACSIGLNGSRHLCNLIPDCNVCSIIRNGFKANGSKGICTTAASGGAHEVARILPAKEKRAMLVCRVIAGRVKKNHDMAEEFDSVAGSSGIQPNLDELYVFSPRAILPCFVVIYRAS